MSLQDLEEPSQETLEKRLLYKAIISLRSYRNHARNMSVTARSKTIEILDVLPKEIERDIDKEDQKGLEA